jgi:hypothetical protein
MERLDHGVLSIPNRTKNINADLDRYKAEQAKILNRKMEDRKFLYDEYKRNALELYGQLEKRHFSYFAKHASIKLSDAKIELKLMCVNPQKAIVFFNQIIREVA